MMVQRGVLVALCLIITGVVAGCRSEAAGAQDIFEYRDIGSTVDFDTAQNIYLEKDTSFGENNWPIYWQSSTDDIPTPFYEDRANFWWVVKPPVINSGVIGSRAIKFHHHGRFRVRADRLPSGGTLYLTLRYKDDVLAPVPVFSWNGSDWTNLGSIGGKRDHRWKTQQFAVIANARSADDFTYVFKVGLDQYKNTIKGELLLDRIKLGTTRNRPEFLPDAAGLWPTTPKNRFDTLVNTMEFIPGEGAFFPFGAYDFHWITDGGSRTKAGRGSRDSWQILQDAGLNCYVLHGWEQNWGSQWNLFPEEETTQWASPGILAKPGLKEHLFQAAAHGLKVIPNFLTDTRGYWIKHTYGSETKSINAIGNVMAQYANDPNILMWYPVDEWDHEDDAYGKPHLYSHLLYHTARLRAPQRARFLLCMGFRGADVWKLATEDADVLGVDVYPDKGNVEGALVTQAERLDHIRSVVGRTKPYILVPQLWEEDKPALSQSAIIAQAYIAFIHGARGILYFRAVHPAQPNYPPHHWNAVKQVSRELFGADGISKVLLPPSKPVDLLGESKIVTCSNPNIHASLFEDAQGRRTLIALNMKKTPMAGVRFTITGLGNHVVTTRFEANRRLTAQNNAFTDNFAAFQRHVYNLY